MTAPSDSSGRSDWSDRSDSSDRSDPDAESARYDPSRPSVETREVNREERPDRSTAAEPRSADWWYLVAAVPVVYVVPFLLVGVALVWLLFAAVGAGVSPDAFALAGGLGFGLLMVGALAVGALTVLVTLLLPVALYKDIEAIEHADPEWTPDRDLYVIVSLAGLFVGGLSAVVALYYLYQRHVHVGVP